MATCIRDEARLLLHQLTRFKYASKALRRLFKEFSQYDTRRCATLTQLLHWQNVSASCRLAHVLDDVETTSDVSQLVVRSDMTLTVLGKPALQFAASIYDEELALLIWSGLVQFHATYQDFDLTRQVLDNSADSNGYSALHYAVEAQMKCFLLDICSDLKEYNLAPVVIRVVTQDVTLPINTAQSIGKNIASGGCTLLHLAARNNELDIAKMLIDVPMLMNPKTLHDWDDNSPARVAAIHGHDDLATFFENMTGEAPLSVSEVNELRLKREKIATERYLMSLEPHKAMLEPSLYPHIWSDKECFLICKEVKRTAAEQGWCKERHAAYQTTDMPCHQVAVLYSWVRSTLTDRLFPRIAKGYNISKKQQLLFRDLFFVKYEARGTERSELALHRDGSVLSFNILLNLSSEFTGGGTYFDTTQRTIHVNQGDALVHSGKVIHGGSPILTGTRLILVGFLDIVDCAFE